MNSLDVDILSPDVCMQHASGQKYNINIEYGTLCVKSHNINHNMCQTEIGGPLACQRENGIYELAGLYSQDNGCSSTNQVNRKFLFLFIIKYIRLLINLFIILSFL